MGRTRVDLLVGSNSIGIDDGLVASSELVDLEVRWWGIRGLHTVQDGGHGRTTALLKAAEENQHILQLNPRYNLAILNEAHPPYQYCISLLTVPLVSALCISSRSSTGHQHSAIRHRWVTSRLNMFMTW